jgi:protein-tyrosine phosphatase
MTEVTTGLYVSGIEGCSSDIKYKIHACKLPCFMSSRSENYLANEVNNNLYLNIVDMDKEPKADFMNTIFKSAFRFIDAHINEGVIIHCNEGKSRAPSIAMAYLAARNKIENKTFAKAANAFVKLYDNYWVHSGLESYLRNNWNHILNFPS